MNAHRPILRIVPGLSWAVAMLLVAMPYLQTHSLTEDILVLALILSPLAVLGYITIRREAVAKPHKLVFYVLVAMFALVPTILVTLPFLERHSFLEGLGLMLGLALALLAVLPLAFYLVNGYLRGIPGAQLFDINLRRFVGGAAVIAALAILVALASGLLAGQKGAWGTAAGLGLGAIALFGAGLALRHIATAVSRKEPTAPSDTEAQRASLEKEDGGGNLEIR